MGFEAGEQLVFIYPSIVKLCVYTHVVDGKYTVYIGRRNLQFDNFTMTIFCPQWGFRQRIDPLQAMGS